ncbi:hypothetical protein H0H93_008248 [Arthromyces matolae]|nr:hypothetical protein H0H93_008248 [Arthromyces matolae]
MPNPMLNIRGGRGGGLGRNHNYQAMYEPDPKGQEISANARVWRVYLDEADAYDSDMIDGFRTILDSLIVFASLFSAVVTSFVIQTSQVLQPNNQQIIAAFLLETNKLLRAAGNITKIDAIPPSSIALNTTTYTPTDVWVNGLFFISLTLSVTASLLTVLAKHWIQAYIEVVPGDAKTQAMLRQFRFDGLTRWNLKTIIEALPLVLHSSVAIFLVGLSLYISQMSPSICALVSVITASTFIFYLGTSMVPAFSIDCPYRLPSMFPVTRFFVRIALMASYRFRNLVADAIPYLKGWAVPQWRWGRLLPRQTTLKSEESTCSSSHREAWPCLSWLFRHSTNTSTKDVVVEGVTAALVDSDLPPSPSTCAKHGERSILCDVLKYSFHCQNLLEEKSHNDETIDRKSIWSTAVTMILSTPPKYLSIPKKPFHGNFFLAADIWKRYTVAIREKEPRIIRNCVSLINASETQFEELICKYIMMLGSRDDLLCAMAQDNLTDVLCVPTWLHEAAAWGNMELVIALLDMKPEWINFQWESRNQQTPLEYALSLPIWPDRPLLNPYSQVLEYLLDHGASRPLEALHSAVFHDHRCDVIKLLLDRGWDRTAKNESSQTPIDIARIWRYRVNRSDNLELLEHYQTVPLPHPSGMLPTSRSSSNTAQALEDAELQPEVVSLAQDTSVDPTSTQTGNDHFQIDVAPYDGGTLQIEYGV